MTDRSSSSTRRLLVFTLALFAARLDPAAAQTAPAPPAGGGGVVFSSTIRSRTYAWDWFGDEPGGDYVYQGTQVRGGLARSGPRRDWQIEFEAPFPGVPANCLPLCCPIGFRPDLALPGRRRASSGSARGLYLSPRP